MAEAVYPFNQLEIKATNLISSGFVLRLQCLARKNQKGLSPH